MDLNYRTNKFVSTNSFNYVERKERLYIYIYIEDESE